MILFHSQDELAKVLVSLFDTKHLLSPLLWNMFYREVEVSDCMQTLFRGNSLGSKLMAYCFKLYGQNYLHNLLEPLITPLLGAPQCRFEVDPARFALRFSFTVPLKEVIFDLYRSTFVNRTALHIKRVTYLN